jgi:hypothetical protein
MAAIRRLIDLAVGSTALLPVRLTAKGASGATLEALTKVGDAWVVTGSFSIAAPGGAVTGAWTTDPRDQPVRVLAFNVAVGDVMDNDQTGERQVAQAVGLGPDADRWSPSRSGRPMLTGEGWTKVGTFTPP